MDYKNLFQGVRDRTAMYLDRQTYEEASAFVYGCDAGNDFCLLHGFREWLIVRINWGNNLGWSRLVLREAFPNAVDPFAILEASKENHRHAINVLFDLLAAFFDARSQNNLGAIFESYAAWERKQ